ncbi:hypothetical protein [Tardiphaga sp. OK246]|uniref:hypothetical protein n=1 Tax=Tardiphaga sp. OK246 TaxID=1855307 RepID=UPI001FCD807C|nr:hypothetical protein [Tardiphaga sp. OK246]
MKVGTPKEAFAGEARVAMTPDSALQLRKLSYSCAIQSGAGRAAGFSDEADAKAGVELVPSAEALWATSDIIAKVRPPKRAEEALLTSGKTLISLVYPAQN